MARQRTLKAFIGSSGKMLPYAWALKTLLKDEFPDEIEPIVWDEPGIIPPGNFTWTSLEKAADESDIAFFIFGGDVQIKEEDEEQTFKKDARTGEYAPIQHYVPNSNVLLETGYFMAKNDQPDQPNGRRTFYFCTQFPGNHRKLIVPSDFDGITYLPLQYLDGCVYIKENEKDRLSPIDRNKAFAGSKGQLQTIIRAILPSDGRSARPASYTAVSVMANVNPGSDYLFGGYEWIVLDKDEVNNRVLLLSKKIFEQRRYHDNNEPVTWEECDLRAYLNRDFYEKMFIDSEDRDRIAGANGEIVNQNAKNQWFNTKGGKETKDKIFLLSIEEVVKYLGVKEELQMLEHRPNDNAWFIGLEEGNKKRIANYGDSPWWWWLRSPGSHVVLAAYVGCDGHLSLCGYPVSIAEGGVRPALWLNL